MYTVKKLTHARHSSTVKVNSRLKLKSVYLSLLNVN